MHISHHNVNSCGQTTGPAPTDPSIPIQIRNYYHHHPEARILKRQGPLSFAFLAIECPTATSPSTPRSSCVTGRESCKAPVQHKRTPVMSREALAQDLNLSFHVCSASAHQLPARFPQQKMAERQLSFLISYPFRGPISFRECA
jgi:hypothetical protein